MSDEVMSDEVLNSDNSEALTEDISAVNDVTPRHILTFAKWILAILAFIFLIGMAAECFLPGNAVFETCKITLPSMASVVLGYYFGTTK